MIHCTWLICNQRSHWISFNIETEPDSETFSFGVWRRKIKKDGNCKAHTAYMNNKYAFEMNLMWLHTWTKWIKSIYSIHSYWMQYMICEWVIYGSAPSAMAVLIHKVQNSTWIDSFGDYFIIESVYISYARLTSYL